ncbi:hypothetical protein CNMCM5793_006912 [Aspergillus hiratsukae]|uniref:ATP-dependent DNA helicase n=1 Tax=Aspergillus hiratsukae TaxID=1194566 RepID=A0A8H6PIB0_9EURO|nr:hypothetical protein CNMCM5793_006912 [Aspergillus hiratsukae]KAF7173830.1 hypothetical protein CNMCM6106_007940 [Aspergillus hiratsukae]
MHNLQANPHIVAAWFHIRYNAFKETVLYPKFTIVDEWNRYEWQGRGSTHNHGIYWVEGAPESEELDLSEPLRRHFAAYWGVHVSAVNPQPGSAPQGDRPAIQLAFKDQRNTFQHLSNIVNRVQAHICNHYCMRKNKETGVIRCRFHFPQEIRDEPVLAKPEGSGYYRLLPIRNDPNLNAYNRIVSMSWLANTDVNPCTGTKTILDYIAKYMTKGEKATESYRDVMKRLLPRVNHQNPLRSAMNNLLNQLIGGRDWSAQEVCHLLLDLPLQHGSRQVVDFDCRPGDEHRTRYFFAEEREPAGDNQRSIRRGLSLLEKYKRRPGASETLTLLEFLRCYDFNRCKRRPRAPDRVINYFPIYKYSEQLEEYARMKLMLHHPFREVNMLKELDSIHFETFHDAYNHCSAVHPDHGPDAYGDHESDEEDELDELLESDDEDVPISWELLARQAPRNDDATHLEDPNRLGERDLDCLYDWNQHVGRYPRIDGNYWDQMKSMSSLMLAAHSSAHADGLEVKQRQLYDLIISNYRQSLAGDRPDQLLINFDGKAGTGKSHVIMLISRTLEDMATEAGVTKSPIYRAAPTVEWPHITSNSMQSDFQGVRFLIIDEKSMIGFRTIFWIDQRCRDIFPEKRTEPFGGLNIVLAGDFYQLPPVKMKPLYSGDAQTMDEVSGRNAYRAFAVTIELDVVKRQEGVDETAVRFKQALDRLREDKIEREDWELLTSRVQSVVPNEVPLFRDAIRIYPFKGQVETYNHDRLRDSRQPVIRIQAVNTGRGAAKASTDEAGGLSQQIELSIGCRVMLNSNLWTEAGLVNGAFSTVHDIIWAAGSDVRKEPPNAILVHFDHYSGEPFQILDGKPVVPILPAQREFQHGSVACRRLQFPLTIAYAITVHESQGMTVSQAVLDISKRDFTPGIRYVAVSRVKTLQGILFEESFDLQSLLPNIDAFGYIPLPPSLPPFSFESNLPICSSPLKPSSLRNHDSRDDAFRSSPRAVIKDGYKGHEGPSSPAASRLCRSNFDSSQSFNEQRIKAQQANSSPFHACTAFGQSSSPVVQTGDAMPTPQMESDLIGTVPFSSSV